MFFFHPFSDGQIKQYHDAKMLYTSLLNAERRYTLQYRYKMVWQKGPDGVERLAKQPLKGVAGKREYLGRRSAETEKIQRDFQEAKERAKEHLDSLKQRMDRIKRLNKAEGIGRAPKELVAIFRKINELGLDDKLVVIGTNSLYAYEAAAGVAIEQEHLATVDIDILNRRDKGVSFVFRQLMLSGKAIEILQSIDRSFHQIDNTPYRFENKDGVWVELINPVSHSVKAQSFKDNLFSDVISLPMPGMQWLENSRLFTETIIGIDGSCANVTTINPVEFAIYKNWLGKQKDRDVRKGRRDISQSRLVTQLIGEYMPQIDIHEEVRNIRHIKTEAVAAYRREILGED